MSGYWLGVEAIHVCGTSYQVFCNRCSTRIGQLSYKAIREAVFLTIGRGGVLCPDCRKKTCDSCAVWSQCEEYPIIDTAVGRVRICPECENSYLGALLPVLESKADDLRDEMERVPGGES